MIIRACSYYNRRGTIHDWTVDVRHSGLMRPLCGHPTREPLKNLDTNFAVTDKRCANCERRSRPAQPVVNGEKP